MDRNDDLNQVQNLSDTKKNLKKFKGYLFFLAILKRSLMTLKLFQKQGFTDFKGDVVTSLG